MLTEELKRLIGKTARPVVLEIERGAIRKYADAVGDRNPLHWDEDRARAAGHSSLVTPPCFFGWPVSWSGAMPFVTELRDELFAASARAGCGRGLNGEGEFAFFRPICAGERLLAIARVKDIYEKQGRSGRMIMLVTETTYAAEGGEVVAVATETTIRR